MMGVNMRKLNQQIVLMLLLVLVTALAGCQGESPTAPKPTSGGGTGSGGGVGSGGTGGTPPPTGSTVTVSVSNPNPLVLSTTQVTATVTVAGQPAPNGTAVEFSTDFGTFTDTNALTTIRTTTGGAAAAILTATTAGTAVVTVRVNNVNQRVSVIFKNQDPTPGGPPAFGITSISPATGKPSGGDIVVIKGTSFKTPVRVLFGTKEAVVISVTDTEIRVITPSINLGGTTQFQDAVVTVINQAGSTSEAQRSAPTPFRYQVEILTPIIYTVSPASGPTEGNTRITIFGEGFQAPTRVFFGTGGAIGSPLTDQVELEVISVSFSQIIAVTPPASGFGSNLQNANGQVTMRVLNVGTNKDAVLGLAFRYGPQIRITAAGPTQGDTAGGTQVTIDGSGFDDPVAVTLGGIAATPIRVSGTQLVVISGAARVTSCAAPAAGPIVVTNVEDGQTASGPTFTYTFVKPVITGISPSNVVEGGTVTVTIANAGPGPVSFQIGDQTVFATQVSPGVYSFVVPTNLTFQTQPCVAPTGNGTQNIPTSFNVTFLDSGTTCTQTLNKAVVVAPNMADSVCKVTTTTPPPPPTVLPPAQDFGTKTINTTSSSTQSICNTSQTATLTINGPGSISGPDAAQFGITSPLASNTSVAPGACATFQFTFTPTSVGAKSASYNVNTSGGAVTILLSGTGQ